MLTTVELVLQDRCCQFVLHKGDNLYDVVSQFAEVNNVSDIRDMIFDMLLEHFQSQNVHQTPRKKWKVEESLTSLRAEHRKQHCAKYSEPKYSEPPPKPFQMQAKQHQYGHEHSPFSSRLHIKQLVHKDHNERHEPVPIVHYPYSPTIQHQSNAIPFTSRLDIKQLNHKAHSTRHEPPVIVHAHSPTINKHYKCSASPFKERQHLKQIVHKDHQERHCEYKPLKKPTKQYIRTRESSDDEHITELLYRDNCFVEVQHNQQQLKHPSDCIQNYVQLNRLINKLYSTIKSKKVDMLLYNTCILLYRNMISTQVCMNNLRYDKLQYELLDNDEIALLTQIQEHYRISYALEITQQQFIILVLSMSGVDDGTHKIGELLYYDDKLTASYQRLN